jgi:hypothetical protein
MTRPTTTDEAWGLFNSRLFNHGKEETMYHSFSTALAELFSPQSPTDRALKYLNRVDGKTYEFVSQDVDLVAYRREGRDTLHYLGRSEFDKRFDLIIPAPVDQVLVAIAAERARQIAAGYDAAHDDEHRGGEIVLADWGARARIEAAINAGRAGDSPAYKELLTEAAAQCVAEIERVKRAEGKANG